MLFLLQNIETGNYVSTKANSSITRIGLNLVSAKRKNTTIIFGTKDKEELNNLLLKYKKILSFVKLNVTWSGMSRLNSLSKMFSIEKNLIKTMLNFYFYSESSKIKFLDNNCFYWIKKHNAIYQRILQIFSVCKKLTINELRNAINRDLVFRKSYSSDFIKRSHGTDSKVLLLLQLWMI